MKMHLERGQALIETALVLPALFFLIIVYLYLLMLCHNAVELQRSAFVAARELSVMQHPNAGIAGLKARAAILGRATPAQFSQTTMLITPWRAYGGIAVTRAPGSLLECRASSIWLPRSLFGRWLPSRKLQFSALISREPALPPPS